MGIIALAMNAIQISSAHRLPSVVGQVADEFRITLADVILQVTFDPEYAMLSGVNIGDSGALLVRRCANRVGMKLGIPYYSVLPHQFIEILVVSIFRISIGC